MLRSTAVVERGFSIERSIKTRLRNRLSTVVLDSIMRVKLLSNESFEAFDFVHATSMFHAGVESTPLQQLLVS